jgi:sugar lactone lactonase YvrE
VADGTGSEARFYKVASMASAKDGTQYVADLAGLRKVSSSGNVTTLITADAQGNAVDLASAQYMAVDPAGAPYVGRSDAIWRINAAGTATKLAVNPEIDLILDAAPTTAYLGPIAFDQAGNLFVVDLRPAVLIGDTAYASVRKVAPDGTVTAYAPKTKGTPLAAATDAAGNLYVSLYVDNFPVGSAGYLIMRVGADGSWNTVAGHTGSAGAADGLGTAAGFTAIAGMAAAPDGSLLISDTSGIRRVAPDGAVTTLAGSQPVDSAGPVSVDANNVVRAFNGPVLRVVSGSGPTVLAGAAFPARIYSSADGAGSTAGFIDPQGITADTAGNLYVAESQAHVIRKISPTGVVTTLAGATGIPGSADGTGAAARFNTPVGIIADKVGNLFVTDRGNATVRKITPDGKVTTFAGTAGQQGYVNATGTAARLFAPRGIAIDSHDNLYVTDEIPGVRKITPAGVMSTVVEGKLAPAADEIGLLHVGGIAVDAGDNLYLLDTPRRMVRISASGILTTFIETAAGQAALCPQNPCGAGMATDAAGNIYFTAGNFVRRATPAGAVSTVAGANNSDAIRPGKLPGSLLLPVGLTRMAPFSLAVTSGSSVLRLDLP